jgi:putative transposase
VDTLGNLLKVTVHPADFQDAEGAELLLYGMREVLPRFAKLWADQAYKPVRDWVATELGWDLETVARPVDQHGFEVLPRRWVVERTQPDYP